MPVHRESHGLAVAAPMHPTALGIGAAGQRCRRARGMAVRQRIARQRVGVVPTAERLWPVDQADLAPADRDQERVVVGPSVGWGAEPCRYCYGALIGPWLTLKSGASENPLDRRSRPSGRDRFARRCRGQLVAPTRFRRSSVCNSVNTASAACPCASRPWVAAAVPALFRQFAEIAYYP
jgi:hypothetical protein